MISPLKMTGQRVEFFCSLVRNNTFVEGNVLLI